MEHETDAARSRAGPPEPSDSDRQKARSQSGARVLSLLVNAALISLLLLALLLIVNPFPRWVAPPVPNANLSLAQVIAYRGGALLVGLLLLVTVVLLGASRIRAYVFRIERLQSDACPVCGSHDLRRIHRRWYHRLPGVLGIPVRRYVCASCQWRGGRIDRQRSSHYRSG